MKGANCRRGETARLQTTEDSTQGSGTSKIRGALKAHSSYTVCLAPYAASRGFIPFDLLTF